MAKRQYPTPTLAQLRKLAEEKGRVIKVSKYTGPFPLTAAAERAELFAALSALPDKGGPRG